MTTELIASSKPVVSRGQQLVIVTTASGAIVWVAKDQFNPSADQISYNSRKAGESYTKSTGETAVLAADRNEFVGTGKISKFAMLDYMAKLGISPSLS
jgi:hypothetical protein